MDHDPIVPQLAHWLSGPSDGPVPVYPAAGVVDPRPREVVPVALRAIDPANVWETLHAAGLQLGPHYLNKYNAVDGRRVLVLNVPCDERPATRRHRRIAACDCASGAESLPTPTN